MVKVEDDVVKVIKKKDIKKILVLVLENVEFFDSSKKKFLVVMLKKLVIKLIDKISKSVLYKGKMIVVVMKMFVKFKKFSILMVNLVVFVLFCFIVFILEQCNIVLQEGWYFSYDVENFYLKIGDI